MKIGIFLFAGTTTKTDNWNNGRDMGHPLSSMLPSDTDVQKYVGITNVNGFSACVRGLARSRCQEPQSTAQVFPQRSKFVFFADNVAHGDSRHPNELDSIRCTTYFSKATHGRHRQRSSTRIRTENNWCFIITFRRTQDSGELTHALTRKTLCCLICYSTVLWLIPSS